MIGHAIRFMAFKIIEIIAVGIVAVWLSVLGNWVCVTFLSDQCGFLEGLFFGVCSFWLAFVCCALGVGVVCLVWLWIVKNWEWTEE